ncbi:MAG: hypothetical protein HY784_09890 [Chloroflexi bacterium]|nr:hypothetical protein [Chloroflexota bacterium]
MASPVHAHAARQMALFPETNPLLKEMGALDPVLCRLALASRAPVWTLDSDFWCAADHYPEIQPVCPAEARASML